MPPSPLARLRKICLALPEAHEVESHGEPTFRVCNKVFAMYANANNHHGKGRHAVWCTAAPGHQLLLTTAAPDRFFVPPYVGPRGWVGVYLDRHADWTRLAEMLRDSHRLVAPKRLLRALHHVLLVAAAAVLAWSVTASAQVPQPPRGYAERVEVARVVVDARVLDAAGRAVIGLGANDFIVKIDGKPARVESALWVGGDEPHAGKSPPTSTSLEGADRSPPGRLIVLLFQKSMERSRIVGLMRMLIETRSFLDTLGPGDRVAVLSFDSHLKVWTDFTDDRERLRRILQRGVLLERPLPLQPAAGFSLVERLKPEEGRRASSIEQGLALIANALEPLPGAKSIVLVGHGFGRLGYTGVTMEYDYEPARRALLAARASVFSLDVTDADYHSLEAGLQLVSEETGGFFARTHLFPALAMRRLAGALAGYYVLFVEKPESRRRTHQLDVRLTRGPGTVLARSGYEE